MWWRRRKADRDAAALEAVDLTREAVAVLRAAVIGCAATFSLGLALGLLFADLRWWAFGCALGGAALSTVALAQVRGGSLWQENVAQLRGQWLVLLAGALIGAVVTAVISAG